MDFEALRCGDFQHNLEAALAGTPVVVVVLTPGALTSDARWPGGGRYTKFAPSPGQSAGEDPKDWMQHEIDLARRSGPPWGRFSALGVFL